MVGLENRGHRKSMKLHGFPESGAEDTVKLRD